jgi:hypothetical protein
MIFKTYEITVDLIKDAYIPEVIRFSQNDLNSAKLLLNLTRMAEELDLSTAKSVRMSFKKPDGTRVFQNDCQPINPLKGKYQIVLKTQTLAAAGDVIAQVHIEEEDRTIDTQAFYFKVNKSLSSDEAIESTNEYGVIQKIIEANEKLEDVDFDALIASKETAEQAKAAATQNTNQIGILSKSVSDIVTDLKLTNGADCTAIIQAALDKKGWVRIVSPGTFITGRLLIDDDTKFELMPGVNLKKKDGTNNYIIVNKGHVQGYRNKNITLKGGKWLLNSTGNPTANGDLSTNPQSWSGIGILFNKVDNLIIEDIKDIGGESKYCFLIVDINQGKFLNITMNNESDGLHFQPPLKNINIENISGVTHDDLISFTMGDYQRYSLGQLGNIENVAGKNIYGGPTTDTLVKMVGSGLDGKSVFKNIKFENLGGYANAVAVRVMKEDQATPNPCLKDTRLENVIFENINVKIERTGQPYMMIGAHGDITIRKLLLKQSDSTGCIVLDQCSLTKLVFDDITVTKSTGTEATDFLVTTRNTSVNTIDQIILKDSNIELNSSAVGSLITTSDKGIKNISISNVKIDAPASTMFAMTGSNTDGTIIKVDNSYINCNIFFVGSIKSNIFMANSILITATRTLHLSDNSDIRVLTSSSVLSFSVNGMSAARKLSASGDLKAANLLTDFTAAQYGDRILYDRPTDQTNKGIYNYNGTAWVKFNF